MRITITLLTLFQSVWLFAQTANVTTGCAPLEVKFTPPQGVSTYFWNFQDGGASNLPSPSNIFTTPGTYAVEFRETPTGPIVGTVAVTVYPKPAPGFTAVPESGCIPLTVKFTDTTQLAGDIQILGYSWVFGDGGPGTGPNPTHIYNTVGNFTVSLELTTNYSTCNVTQVFQNRIRTGIKPQVAFTTVPSPAAGCDPPLNVSFTNTTQGGSGTLTYTWNFGNGNTSTLVDPPAQTYTQTGAYTVTLTASDAVGCSASITRPVNIGHPVADFVVPDTICLGDTISMQNTSAIGSYAWNFGPFATPATSQQQNPKVTFTVSGLQTITLVVTTAGNCSSTATKQIFVDEANANFTVAPKYSCSDPTVFALNASSPLASQWSWTFSDSTTSNIKNPVFTWTAPDISGYTHLGLWLDTIRLTVTNPSGCSAEFIRIDSIWRPNARFVPDRQHGCVPLTVVFADSSISNEPIVQWTWLFDDGSAPLVNTNNNPATHTFTTPGDYNVRLVIRNSAGCIDTSYSILIEAGVPIPGDFTADKFAVCPGDTVQFTNLTTDPRVDGWHFSSDSDRQWHCFQEDNPSWVYNSETGSLSVSLTTEYNGCFSTVTKEEFIQVKGPIAQLHYKTTCENTLEFDFTDESHGATQVTWYLGNGDSTLQNTFSYPYAAPGAYTVILKAENPLTGCPVSYDSATVYATNLVAMCEIPDTVCGGEPINLDARKSLGVNAVCFKGYTWYFSWQRPIRTDKDTLEFLVGPSGDQTICLEVEDINGCKDTVKKDIVIYNRYPQIKASDNLICIPGTVSFTDLSSADVPIVSWEWDFGDNSPKSTDQNPTHTYTTPPPNGQFFTVNLIFMDEQGCPGTATININVYKPVSNILTLPQPANICEGQSVAFAATDFTAGGSSLSWKWNFGNGNTATGQGANQIFDTPGQYLVKLVYTEIATGCKDSTTTPVNVQGYPQANFASNVDGQNIICYPQNMELNNTTVAGSQVSVFWNLGNGITQSGNQAFTAFPTPGTYAITLTATTSFGCSDDTTRSFTVVGPLGKFTLDKNEICKGGTVTFTLKDTTSVSTWSWSFGDGTPTVFNQNPVTHQFNFQPPSNVTVVKLILVGEDAACTAPPFQLPVYFSPVKADFEQASTGCAGASIAFNNTSIQADLSSWRFGDGATSLLLNPDHIYAAEGNYMVTLTVTDLPLGCVDSITKTISITGIPDLKLFGATTICPNDTAMIGVESPQLTDATFIWSPANLVVAPKDEAIVKVVPTQTTTFTVKVIDNQGCQDQADVTITIPTAYMGAQNLDTIVGKGSDVTLPVTYNPQYSFTWSPLPGPQGDPPVWMDMDSSRVDTLFATDLFNCTESVFTFKILVAPEKVFAPNAFTPDSDGNNDTFLLLADGEEALVRIVALKVYSRWGQLMYEGAGPLGTTGWDGRSDGKEAPSDVYAWVAEVEFLTGRRVTLKGDLTLLR
ncbi:MAG: PKD domain-containing protein [Saprospirales bacterium]|nr:PKD domain-containing protein [Saprospirales bacterium]